MAAGRNQRHASLSAHHLAIFKHRLSFVITGQMLASDASKGPLLHDNAPIACSKEGRRGCAGLVEVLRSARTSASEAAEAIRHLLQLQADGATCAQDTDPVHLYLRTQVCPWP